MEGDYYVQIAATIILLVAQMHTIFCWPQPTKVHNPPHSTFEPSGRQTNISSNLFVSVRFLQHSTSLAELQLN